MRIIKQKSLLWHDEDDELILVEFEESVDDLFDETELLVVHILKPNDDLKSDDDEVLYQEVFDNDEFLNEQNDGFEHDVKEAKIVDDEDDEDGIDDELHIILELVFELDDLHTYDEQKMEKRQQVILECRYQTVLFEHKYDIH